MSQILKFQTMLLMHRFQVDSYLSEWSMTHYLSSGLRDVASRALAGRAVGDDGDGAAGKRGGGGAGVRLLGRLARGADARGREARDVAVVRGSVRCGHRGDRRADIVARHGGYLGGRDGGGAGIC